MKCDICNKTIWFWEEQTDKNFYIFIDDSLPSYYRSYHMHQICFYNAEDLDTLISGERMGKLNLKPKWTENHDKIVKEYEKKKKEDKIKEMRIISKDEESEL